MYTDKFKFDYLVITVVLNSNKKTKDNLFEDQS